METQSLSLSLLQDELMELQKDRTAFASAYDLLRKRIQESLNTTRSNPPLHKWSGSRAVMGSLEMTIAHVECSIEEHSKAIGLIRDGVIHNADKDTPVRALRIIQGGDGE